MSAPSTGYVFTTRADGVSAGPYDSLNVGALTDDHLELVQRNRQIAAQLTPVDSAAISSVRQVHGTGVLDAADAAGGWAEPSGAPEADALITRPGAGVAMAIVVADCAPIVIVGADSTLAVVHAGWRGLAAGILEAVGDRMQLAGSRAAIGPAIGPCCFEVGHEVADAFPEDAEHVPVVRHVVDRSGGMQTAETRLTVDLPGAAARQLRRLGVQQIDMNVRCTSCDARYFSHRRDGGVTGRQCLLAWQTV